LDQPNKQNLSYVTHASIRDYSSSDDTRFRERKRIQKTERGKRENPMKKSGNNSSVYTEIMKRVRSVFVEKGSPILAEARREILREKIESTDVREALEFHMDRWQDLTRPALMALACEAVGGDPKNIVQVAKAVIHISGAVDLHDDIIDHSMVKKSKPTPLAKFGREITLLAADALLFEGLTVIYELFEQTPIERAVAVVKTIRKLLFELGDGEAMELRFRGKFDVKPEEYLRVVRKKAADVEAYTRVGAILGGGSKKDVASLGEYGRVLGMMIILRDDLEDMLDFEVEMPHRVKNEALPLPVLYALQKTGVKRLIASILKKEKFEPKDAEEIFQLTDEAGGLKYMSEVFKRLETNALDFLGEIEKRRDILSLVVQATVPPL
jgi:geranylgeranyl diphosphate synthase type I